MLARLENVREVRYHFAEGGQKVVIEAVFVPTETMRAVRKAMVESEIAGMRAQIAILEASLGQD